MNKNYLNFEQLEFFSFKRAKYQFHSTNTDSQSKFRNEKKFNKTSTQTKYKNKQKDLCSLSTSTNDSKENLPREEKSFSDSQKIVYKGAIIFQFKKDKKTEKTNKNFAFTMMKTSPPANTIPLPSFL